MTAAELSTAVPFAVAIGQQGGQLAHPLAGPPPDPAFAATRALDEAGEAWSAAFQPWAEILAALDPGGARDWGNSAAVARAALGGAADGTVRALAAYEARLAALEVDVAEAEALFRATRAASEVGTAAMRAAARRYVARPGGWAGDAEALMGGPAVA